MADDGYYSSEYSSDTSSTQQPTLSLNRCREILSHGNITQVSSCSDPDFYTTTIDGRCYNCGGMGMMERDRLYDRDRYRESRGNEVDGYERKRNYDGERRRESHRGNEYYGPSYSLSGRDTHYSSSSPPKKERGYEQDRRTSAASSSRGDTCCDSPNFWTTTIDGSCYNCGRR